RLPAGGAELADDDLRGLAVPVADQRLRGELAEGGPAPRAEGRVGRGDEHVLVAQELDRLERGRLRVERELDERDVELAPLDAGRELAREVRLAELDLDRGPRPAEALQHLRQDLRADALEGADAERAGLAARERGEVGLRGLEARDDRLRVPQQPPPRLGQRHRPRSARALDEALADDPLERRDLLADRRLGVAELLGGTAEGALAGDRLEGGQVAK